MLERVNLSDFVQFCINTENCLYESENDRMLSHFYYSSFKPVGYTLWEFYKEAIA